MTEPGPRIGTGATADVFAFGDGVLKLYHAGGPRERVQREADILVALEQAGIPAPRSRGLVGQAGRWGLAMTRAGGRPFAEAMLADPASVPGHVAALVEMHLAIHAATVPGLRTGRDRLAEQIARAAGLDPAVQQALLARLAAMPVGDRLCHGDFHPFNVLGTPVDAVVIDWVDATLGDPMADLARTHLLLAMQAPDLAAAYVATYLARSGRHRDDMEAWLPLVAAGRLAENIAEAERDLLMSIATG